MDTQSHPKERLEIDNFLVIKRAHFDVKRINVIIGEQASGKSVIAKVLYFFRNANTSVSRNFFKNIDKDLPEEWLYSNRISIFTDTINTMFYEYFKLQYWQNHDFSLNYMHGECNLSITHEKGQEALALTISEALDGEIKLAIETHIQARNNPDLKLSMLFERPKPRTFFIPTNRIALARPLSSDLNSDIFLSHFTRHYDFSTNGGTFKFADKRNKFKYFKSIASLILKGEYKREGSKISLAMKHGEVDIAHASSGQQEALPMLSVLIELGCISSPFHFIVEEPEAHLFPESQRQLVRLFGAIYNNGHSFFLTTHSPYILVALNNLIMAGNVAREHPDKAAAINEIIPEDMQVNYKDVGAFTINKKGELKSILDAETKTINAAFLDSASDEMLEEYDYLLGLRYDDRT